MSNILKRITNRMSKIIRGINLPFGSSPRVRGVEDDTVGNHIPIGGGGGGEKLKKEIYIYIYIYIYINLTS